VSHGDDVVILFIISLVVIAALLYGYISARYRVANFVNLTTQHANEIQQLQQNENKLREEILSFKEQLDKAITDPITGLIGWKLFEDRLAHEIMESGRYNYIAGVMIIDIDDFRMINDALGQQVGDHLLKEVSERLLACIRQVDTVSRLNKDTFAILLTQLTKPETAAVIAQRVLQSFTQPFYLETHELLLTASIGIAIYPTDAADAAGLLQNATAALQIAKERDKQGFHFYEERLHLNSKRELSIYSGLKRESLYTEIKLLFQPVFDTETNSIICMDAIPEWYPNGSDVIKLDELYQYAEKQRVLSGIIAWMVRMACTQLSKWKSMGLTPYYVGIPVTIKQLESNRLIYNISQILQDVKCSASHLMFIIKDTTMFTPSDELEKSFNMLHYMGVKITINNFGAGYISLAQLKKYPIHYLKLDDGLTNDIHDKQTTVLIESILVLARGLSREVIVQNITSIEQKNRFKELGCHLMQGPLLGIPLAEKDVPEKLAHTLTE